MVGEPREYADKLEKDGIVVVEEFLDDDTCEDLYRQISTAIEEDEIDVVVGSEYSYDELVNWDGAVANKRVGRDDGMIDVFNLDDKVPEVRSFKTDSFVRNVIELATAKSYTPATVNAYWNRSVTDTRDFHADSYSGQFKSFLYLTDVPDRSFGPFCYVKGTHHASKPKKLVSTLVNKLRGKPATDAVFYDQDREQYNTAPKGTLIIANQSGYHRGHPQQEGKERMLLTTSYKPNNAG